MESTRKKRWRQGQTAFEPGFGRMLVISLLFHLLVPILYSSSLFPKSAPIKPPVYRVNLVNKPVKRPQAGRPEAVATQPKPQKKSQPKPKPAPAKPKPVAKKPAVTALPKPKQPPVEPKAEQKSEASVSKVQERALQERLEQLRAAQEAKAADEARKRRLEELKALALAESQQLESPLAEAPVGMPEGKGDEAGVGVSAFVAEFIQQQWSLSKYQVVGNPEAEMVLVYNAAGELLHYRFRKKSGNSIFDDSLVRAISKAKQLPQSLPEQMELDIVFNLKEMLDRK